jgi:hypothetical protein
MKALRQATESNFSGSVDGIIRRRPQTIGVFLSGGRSLRSRLRNTRGTV